MNKNALNTSVSCSKRQGIGRGVEKQQRVRGTIIEVAEEANCSRFTKQNILKPKIIFGSLLFRCEFFVSPKDFDRQM